ncbi:MAG: ATP synthase F1 subunit gamma [Bacteroidetes bacterium]|nr:ATP synthase F1 subunit gamma [Bacteroidota bacterium]
MATLRDIKRRITGVKNTQQITKAMKMVAAARLRKAQDNIINARPYSRKIAEVLNTLLNVEKNYSNDLLEKREVNSVAVLLVTSDRGLCGGFNMSAIREVEEMVKGNFSDYYIQNNFDIYCIGKKGSDYCRAKGIKTYAEQVGVFSHLNFEFAVEMVNNLTGRFIKKEIDKVLVVYNEFKSVVQQKIVTKQLLPIEPSMETKAEGNVTEFIYEPDKVSIINSLLPRYLNSMMWTVLLDSYAAELGARMTAMDMATENAKELIRSLQVTYNKERQAAITNEILEIVSGANALKDA